MLKIITTALAALSLLAAPGCGPLDEDCPACEERCWEGGPQCDRCYRDKGCKLKAQPGAEEPEAELPPLT